MAFSKRKYFSIGIFFLAFALFVAQGQGVAGYGDNRLEIISPDDLEQSHAIKPKKDEAPLLLHEEHIPYVQVRDTPHVTPLVRAVPQNMASYLLGSGDKVKITVFGEASLSDTYLVNEEGFISMPLIGEVSVKGKTIFAAKAIIVSQLKDGYLNQPSVSIEVAEFRPIYIMGEIKLPGSYNFVTDMNIRNAVAIAGGFTYRANDDKIVVTRENESGDKYQIKLKPEDRVHPGDIILVKERFF